MNTPEVMHKDLEALQIAYTKTVIEKRADLWALFAPLREACGDAICGPAMTIFHYGAVKDSLLVTQGRTKPSARRPRNFSRTFGSTPGR